MRGEKIPPGGIDFQDSAGLVKNDNVRRQGIQGRLQKLIRGLQRLLRLGAPGILAP